jgi:uncharacterized protein
MVIVALGLIACATAPPRCETYAPAGYRRPFLWKVSGPRGSLVLYATHQAESTHHVPKAAWAELDRANVFVTEADEFPEPTDSETREQVARMFYLPPGSSLQKMLSDDDYRALKRRVDRPVSNLKPWVAMMLLAREAYPFPSPSINAVLIKRARERGIATAFLESWDDQVRYFDEAVTPAKLSAMIRDYPKLECEMTNRLAAFWAGDDAVFANETTNELGVRRIERWFARLEEYLRSGRTAFVAIGIGQIVGPHGLLVRLSLSGYTVQRL